jgi:hypothetical protein
MTRFDALKSTTIQFSIEELLQNKLDDFLLDELYAFDSSFKEEAILSNEINTKEDVKRLEAFFKENKSRIAPGLYNDCMEDLKEIKDDIRWRATADGKIVLEIERWIAQVREKLASQFNGQSIFVGRSFVDPKTLVVGGVIKDDVELITIKRFIESENPPVVPVYRFEIE